MLNLPKLDRIDLNILAELQRQGRMTNTDLADRVGLSASPCLARVKRLEQAGYITGYNATLNLAKLGDHQIVFTSITLTDHRRSDFLSFEQCIQGYEEVLECHLVSGGFDYLLKFMVRNIAHYQMVIESMLDANIGVTKYFSYIVIKSPVVRGHAPIRALFERQFTN